MTPRRFTTMVCKRLFINSPLLCTHSHDMHSSVESQLAGSPPSSCSYKDDCDDNNIIEDTTTTIKADTEDMRTAELPLTVGWRARSWLGSLSGWSTSWWSSVGSRFSWSPTSAMLLAQAERKMLQSKIPQATDHRHVIGV